MLILTFKDTGERIAIVGESITEFEERPRYKGNVTVQLADGHIAAIANCEIRMVTLVPEAEVEAQSEAAKKKKAEADAAAEARTKAAQEKARLEALASARKTLEDWNGKSWLKRVGRKLPQSVIEAATVLEEARRALDVETSKAPAPAPAPIPAKPEMPAA